MEAKIGFIGLGNVGSKLAGNILRNGLDICVLDLDKEKVAQFVAQGAKTAPTPKAVAEGADITITCLPSPQICSQVMESEDGVLAGLSAGKIWLEMSTTNSDEVKRIAKKAMEKSAHAVDCPVSGGCHRAYTGNIAIFAGCSRDTFEKVLPILKILGRDILHTGELGSASILKVMTNYLATANLVTLCEALAVTSKMGFDMNRVYEAIRISSGNSFVHETESQVILNGSRDINFTMDLVLKDIGMFQTLAEQAQVPLEVSPLLISIFKDGIQRYGEREFSPNIIKRLEEACGTYVKGEGFPADIVDTQPKEPGAEVIPKNRQ